MSSRMTSNGRVTIPKRVGDYLGIDAGTEVAFRLVADGSVVIEKADQATPQPRRLASLCGHAGRGTSTGEIMSLLRGDDR
jgi:antitoxin PrlF